MEKPKPETEITCVIHPSSPSLIMIFCVSNDAWEMVNKEAVEYGCYFEARGFHDCAKLHVNPNYKDPQAIARWIEQLTRGNG